LSKKDYFEKIKQDLQAAGISKGDDVLIHSSFKSLGYIEGGIQTVIEALISQLGDNGTLLFPALSYRTVNDPESGFVFDINNTPCCVGSIPEYFRTYDGVVRSMHPTHSVCAYGAAAQQYVAHHHMDNTPVGAHSPFRLLSEHGGKVLMLGCSTRSNTSMHGVEEAANAPYLLSDEKRRYTIIDSHGNITHTDNYYHYMQQRGYIQRYDRLENLMEFGKCKILNADCNIIDSPTMWKVGAGKIAQEPYYFTDKTQI
jgi:aminoglycoside 3-N-acetyltransferase